MNTGFFSTITTFTFIRLNNFFVYICVGLIVGRNFISAVTTNLSAYKATMRHSRWTVSGGTDTKSCLFCRNSNITNNIKHSKTIILFFFFWFCALITFSLLWLMVYSSVTRGNFTLNVTNHTYGCLDFTCLLCESATSRQRLLFTFLCSVCFALFGNKFHRLCVCLCLLS